MLRIVAERAAHLARLVEDLLLASRISSDPAGSAVVGMQRECTDLAEAARGRRLAARARQPPGDGAAPGHLEVDADPLRLVQVLANLISNAHKYPRPTRRSGCGCGATTAGPWRPWPTRAAHPREELDRVFEKFHQVEDPMTMTTGDTGLGLHIARELTRAMGGEIEATSAPRRGSTFTVRLPLARRPADGDEDGPGGRDRTDDQQPNHHLRRAADPLCRSSWALSPVRTVVHNPRVDRAGAERGATAVAYALMIAIIALLLVGGVFVLSGSIQSALSGGAECVASPGSCEGGSGGGGPGGGGPGGGGGGTTTTTNGGPATTTTGPTTTT